MRKGSSRVVLRVPSTRLLHVGGEAWLRGMDSEERNTTNCKHAAFQLVVWNHPRRTATTGVTGKAVQHLRAVARDYIWGGARGLVLHTPERAHDLGQLEEEHCASLPMQDALSPMRPLLPWLLSPQEDAEELCPVTPVASPGREYRLADDELQEAYATLHAHGLPPKGLLRFP